MFVRFRALALAGVLAALCAGCAQTPRTPSPRTIAGIPVPPPPAPQPQVDRYWGTEVADPYRFLENAADPAVAAWMKAQAEATTAILARIPGRAGLLDRLREIDADASGAVGAISWTPSGRLFFVRREPGEGQFRLMWRDRLDGPDRLLVDPEALGRGTGRRLALLDFAASDDGRRVAYAVQGGGSEIGEMFVVDVDSGRTLAGPIDRIRYASATWLPDGSGLYFSRLREGWEALPAGERFGDRTVWFLSLADGALRPVFSALRDPGLGLPVHASASILPIPGTAAALAVVALGVDRDRLAFVGDLAGAREGRGGWRPLARGADEVRDLAAGGGWIYLLSARGAPRHQVLRVRADAADLGRAETIVPPGAAVVVGIAAARDALYVVRRDGPAMQLLRVPHDAPQAAAPVVLPLEGTIRLASADPGRDGVLVSVAGWTRGTRRFVVRPAAQGTTVEAVSLASVGRFDAPPNLVVREVKVPAEDGTLIPASILSRADLPLDGNRPTLLHGYGAYGITEDPAHNPRRLAWIERGGVYVFAHVRGGGIFGTEWHRQGFKATKPNTWRDGIAVARWLIANRYTSPRRLAITGGSAGGIFVGRAITEEPALFAAAVPSVGVLDVVRAETTANGVANVPEYGTVAREDEFRALLAMSSYHHLRPGVAYPATLLVHGVNDIRVPVWQSAKFAAALAAASTGGPVLMRLDYDLGHGQGSSRTQQQQQIADLWSFVLWQLGEEGFQPPPAP